MAIEDVQPLIGGEGVLEEKKAALSTPESITQRTNSATAYEGLSPSEALSLANSTFPSLGSAPDGGLPPLPEGQTLSSFIGPNAASVSLPSGHLEVLEADGPIAAQTSPGTWTGLNLSLEESNGAFAPKLAVGAPRIPKNLSEGISLPVAKVSMTPLLASGTIAANASLGVSDGYAVFWGGLSSGSDVDMVAKPDASGGFDLESVLRSERSPEILRFAVGLPEGAILEQSSGDTGPVSVSLAGQTIAVILPAMAVDAQGTQVSDVTMSVSGTVLTVTVPHPAGRYAYPLVVDPSVIAYDEWLTGGGGHPTNWRFETNPVTGSKFTSSGWGGSGGLTVSASGSYTLGEDGMLIYPVRPGSFARILRFDYKFQSVVEGHSADVVAQIENLSKEVEKQESDPYNSSSEYSYGINAEWGEVARFALRATGTGSEATVTLTKASVELFGEGGSSAKFNTTDAELQWWENGPTNVLYGGNGWLGPHSNSEVGFEADDESFGISKARVSAGSWSQEFTPYASGECVGVQCNPKFSGDVPYSSKMTNGETTLEGVSENASGATVWAESKKLKVDAVPPHNIVLAGLGTGGQVGGGETQLKAEAADGSGTTPSSGIRSLTLFIDGSKVGVSSGSCSPGPCTAHSGTWVIFGDKYATGQHTIVVEATDNAGNTFTESFPMIVHPATPVALGPGSFDPQSGEYTLSATDVSMGGGLTVSRSYDSEHLTVGEGGPLGAQWGISLGGQESIVKQPTGSMVLTEASGAQVIFASNGSGGYISPAGDSNLTLSTTPCVTGQTELRLKNIAAGTTTCFSVPSGGSGEVWSPRRAEGPAIQDTATYTYETVEVPLGSKKYVTRPHQALAPEPAGVSCTILKAGCKALTFNYATSTTAKGEARTEWGNIEGNLTGISYTAWDTVSKEMKKVEVVHYEYDNRGRLRAAWDPRVTPEPLKTYYGYDTEGHVTALTPPGKETWDFTYGEIPGIETPSAVLKVMQAPASAAVWKGEGLTNIEAPHIFGTPVVGTRVTVAHGVWSPVPVSYAYQWQDCNKTGEECTLIPGATNPAYAVAVSDLGHIIRVKVTATNGGGSVIAYASTSIVSTALTNEYSQTEGSGPFWIVTGPDGNLWSTDASSSKIVKITPAGAMTEYALPAGSGPRGIVAGSDGKLWFTDLATSKIGTITTTGTITEYALPPGSEPFAITEGPDKNRWFADIGTNKIGKITTAGVITEYALPAGTGPYGITSGPGGKLWYTGEVSSKIGSITTAGVVGPEYALPAGSGPWAIIEGSDKNLWFTEISTSKIGKITTSGAVTEYPLPVGSAPRGIASGPEGNVWFANLGTSKVGELPPSWKGPYADSSSNGYQLAPTGGITYPAAGPKPGASAVTLDGSSGYLATTSTTAGNMTGASGVTLEAWIKPNNVADGSYQEIISKTYVAQIDIPAGTNHIRALFGPGYYWSASAEGGALVAGQWAHIAATYDGSVARIYINGVLVATGAEVKSALGGYGYPLVVGAYDYEGPTIGGYFWGSISNPAVYKQALTQTEIQADYSATSEEAYEPLVLGHAPAAYYPFTSRFNEFSLLASSEPRGITTGPEGNMWVAGMNLSKFAKITLKSAEAETLTPEPGTTVEYKVPLSGSGLPTMTKTEVETWGEKDIPAEATAIFPPDEAQSWPATNYKRATIYYRDGTDRTVNVATPSGAISTSEYNEKNDVTRSLSADNRAVALKETKPAEAAKLLDTQSEYNGEGNELLSTLGPRHTVKLTNGKELLARNHTVYQYDEGAPAEGGPYRLVTKTTQGAQTESEGEKDVRTTVTGYSAQSNLGWKLRKPTSVTTDPLGLNLTRTTSYEEATGNVIETTTPASSKSSVNNIQTIFYTSAANSKYANCGERPEWASLPCQTQPTKQPGTSGLPNLPVTTYVYNMYGEPTKTVATVGTETRTTTATYDAAGRPESSETTSTTGTSLPKVTDKYNKTTGALVEQSTSTESLKSEYNTLGQLTTYADADGNTATYEYEKEKDYRLKKTNDGKGTQTYEYDATTGAVKELIDSSAGIFTGSYDVEGNLINEGYPNAMNAKYTLNPVGELTGTEYVKAVHCAKTCPETWYSDKIVPSIHGQWMTQQSNQAAQTYTYDQAGRLTEVLDNVSGVGCSTHIYAYDEETNRLSLTNRPPGTGGACATEGGEVQDHTYDPANRLLDAGTSYDSFGDTTKLPAADAGGTALTSTFYQDGQLASQTQGTQTIGDQLDPAGRTREIVSTGKITKTEIQHYTSPSSTNPSWTGELSTNYTRYIAGIGGTLVAIQHNSEKAVLQLPNQHADIIATATDSETPTALASTITEANEYGVPANETSPKYSWLGASQMPTTLPSGIIAMGARSYIPQLGRFLQTDPMPGGSANAYAYTYGDPVNTTDLSGEWTFATPTWVQEADAGWGAREEQRQLANEQAAREEAERLAAYAAEQAAIWAAFNPPSPTEGGPELPLGGSFGWECQDAVETGQEDAACGGSLHIVSDGGIGLGGHGKGKQRVEKLKHPNNKGPEITCGDAGGAVGGLLGGLLGGLAAGPWGSAAGSTAGAYAGSHMACS